MAKAEHRIEECLKRSKSEAGLADYQVRNWDGWHNHQALSLIAMWFLALEARRGKKRTPELTVPQAREGLAIIFRKASRCDTEARSARTRTRWLERNVLARLYHYKSRKQLAPARMRPEENPRQ